jgi:hypothetical protein
MPAADARRWRGQIGHGVNKGGGEKITLIISVLGIQHGHMAPELQRTWEKIALVFPRLHTYDLLT